VGQDCGGDWARAAPEHEDIVRRRKPPDLDDLEHEIQDHIETETLENLARGMSEPEARTAALRKFGNVVRVKEDVREVWLWICRAE
jgi:hypothetical protein